MHQITKLRHRKNPETGDPEKLCLSGHWKDVTEFYVKRNQSDGLSGRCKSCYNNGSAKKTAERRKSNPEYYAKLEAKRKAEAFQALSPLQKYKVRREGHAS